MLLHTACLALPPLRSSSAAGDIALDIFHAVMDEPQQDLLLPLQVVRDLGAKDGLGLLPRPLVGSLRLGASPLGRGQGIIAYLVPLGAVPTAWFRLVALGERREPRYRIGWVIATALTYLLAESLALTTAVARLVVGPADFPDRCHALVGALVEAPVGLLDGGHVDVLIFVHVIFRILFRVVVIVVLGVLVVVLVPIRILGLVRLVMHVLVASYIARNLVRPLARSERRRSPFRHDDIP